MMERPVMWLAMKNPWLNHSVGDRNYPFLAHRKYLILILFEKARRSAGNWPTPSEEPLLSLLDLLSSTEHEGRLSPRVRCCLSLLNLPVHVNPWGAKTWPTGYNWLMDRGPKHRLNTFGNASYARIVLRIVLLPWKKRRAMTISRQGVPMSRYPWASVHFTSMKTGKLQ